MYRADSYQEDQEMSIFTAIQQADHTQNEQLIHFLISPHVLGILSISGRRSMTVNDMARQLGLPLATCYKLVEQMVEFGLMARVGMTRTSSRGRAANYISCVKNINVKMGEMNLEAVISWKNGMVESLQRGFDGMQADGCKVVRQDRARYPLNHL